MRFVDYVRLPSMRLRLTLVVALALALAWLAAACTPTRGRPVSSPSAGASAAGEQLVLDGARGFALAELAYVTAAQATTVLVRGGVIKGETATKVRALNAEARRLLVTGRAALGAAEKARLAAELLGLTERLDAIRRGS